MAAELQPRLPRWSRNNAVALLAGLLLSALLGRPWPIAVAAGGSFGALLLWTRGEWTPSGHFGAANAVTSLRLALVMILGAALHGASGTVWAALVAMTLLLDGLDGWLARRQGNSSAFGAHFDMEVDALLVLMTSAELWLSQRFAAWVLLAGALRYAYVLCVAKWPPRAELPRTLLGRSAFALVVIGHALGLGLGGAPALLAAALGTAAVTLSFARSFAYAYARSERPLADS